METDRPTQLETAREIARETVRNLASVVEGAQAILARAEKRLAELEADGDELTDASNL